MILVTILVIACLGAAAAWILSRWSPGHCRWAALTALLLETGLVLALWAHISHCGIAGDAVAPGVAWQRPWIPQFGVSVSLAADGLTVVLLLLTCVLGLVAVAASWDEIQERVGFFHFHLMLVLAGVMGVFLARDLFLFYVFWELMLVPMYFLISLWGHENRAYAAIKFFIFTQCSGLLMLMSVLGLYFAHGHQTGDYTFDCTKLLSTNLGSGTAFWLMMGFAAAFFVKLPVVGLHTWLPDAHTAAPTAGNVVSAGLLLKTGAYGLIRFVLPLFPAASHALAPVAVMLGAVGIVYGAILAFGQRDLKRLIAYTSVSHLGFVLLGVFAGSRMALQGGVVIIVAHGLSTGGLFAVAGALQERLHTRDMNALSGLWSTMPRMGGAALFFALASLGLPGLANFVGEFLVLAGSYASHPLATIIATMGLVASTVYSLWLIHRVFYGPPEGESSAPDLCLRETVVFGVMIALLVLIGLLPGTITDTVKPVLTSVPTVTADRGDNNTTPVPRVISTGSGKSSDTE